MNYYIIFGYIFIFLSVLLATIICIDSMYQNNFDVKTYYKLKRRTFGIVKSIECDNGDCMYNIDYILWNNDIKKTDKFYAPYEPKIGEKVNILYNRINNKEYAIIIEPKYTIIDYIILCLLIIIIIILWIFLIITIIFSNNFNKYLDIFYISFTTIFLLFIFNKYIYYKYSNELIKIIILLLIFFILIFNYFIIIFY